jgi:excisionase family DNA binding protein
VLRGELVELDDVVLAGDRPLVEVDLAAAVHASQHLGPYLACFPILQRTTITLALRIAIRDLFACLVHLPGSELSEPSQPGRDEWLSVADVAAELGMHPSTVRKWANDGLLPGMRIGRRQWRFRRSALRLLERERPSGGDQAGGAVRDGSLDPLALTSDADLVEPDER